jgi:hypothetical protein
MIVTLVTTIALVGVSTIFVGRVLYEKKLNQTQEDSTRALFQAFGELAKAEAIINESAYDSETGRNLAVQSALETADKKIAGTEVSVEPIAGMEGTFFHLVSRVRVGRVTRIVRALIREKESFADYNYFVNSHPLGISGNPTPRGSIHTNRAMAFYFPNGVFVDPVTAVEGFDYKAGATTDNTKFLGPTDPNADTVPDLTSLDLTELRDRADIYQMVDGEYDVRIVFDGDRAYIEQWTKPRWDEEFVVETHEVQTGTELMTVTEEVVHYKDETYEVVVEDFQMQDEVYTVEVPEYDTRTVTRTREDPVYDTRLVERTRVVPVYEDQTVTKTRTEQVWVEDTAPGAEGGTAIAGGGDSNPGHWETREVSYEVLERVKVDEVTETYSIEERYIKEYVTVDYTVEEQYIAGYTEEERTRRVRVKVGEHTEERTRQVVDYTEEVEKSVEMPVYEEVTEVTGTRLVYREPEKVAQQDVEAKGGVIYVEGDITSLKGQIDGRVTVVSNGSIHITGNLQYVDAEGRTAYLNGTAPDKAYEPNPDYTGNSVLGIIAREDIVYTEEVPSAFELNGSFLAQQGRVGIAGIELDDEGKVTLTAGEVIQDD